MAKTQSAEQTTTLKNQFDTADSKRSGMMNRTRECAAMSLPWVLTREGLSVNDDADRPYQSLGSSGVSNRVGKTLMTIFPPGVPWFALKPSTEFLTDPSLTPEDQFEWEAYLYARQLLAESQLEVMGYRSKMRFLLECAYVTGNWLARLTEEYGVKTFRLDQYVQKLGSKDQMLWVITRENKDPLELDDQTLSAAGLEREEIKDREDLFLYTKIEIVPGQDKSYIITQELNDKLINESTEKVPSFFVGGYASVGDDYSRGFVEERIGDLKGFNGFSYALSIAAANAAKLLIVNDERSGVTNDDLLGENGAVVNGRVDDGQIKHIAFLQQNKNADLAFAAGFAQTIEQRLGKAMLLDSAMQPTGDRVTKYQSQVIANEADGGDVGIFIHLAEQLQRPFIQRLIFQMEKDNLLPPMDVVTKKAEKIEILTGIEARGRQVEMEKLIQAMQVIATMPNGMQRIREETFLQTILQGFGLDPAKAIKTPQELEAEMQQAMQMQLQQQAGQQAISSTGAIVENAAAQAPAEPAQ